MLFAGYLTNFVGNHYVKVYTGLVAVIAIPVCWYFGDDAVDGIYIFGGIFVANNIFLVFTLLVPSINEIVEDKVYLSNAAAATSSDWTSGITHILDLTGEQKHLQQNVTVHHLYISDLLGSTQGLEASVDEAIDFMEEALHSSTNAVLVHCAAGQSRSAAVVVAYLMQIEGMTRIDAYDLVRKKRPVVDMSSDHMEGLIRLEKKWSSKKKM